MQQQQSENVDQPTTGTDLVVVDFGNDAGKGMQNVGAHEYAIPFLRLIQTNSPQVDPTGGKYIEAAKPGMLLKTSTAEIFEALQAGVPFIPCHRDETYVEYTPRDAGGGFVGIRTPNDPLVLQLKAKQGRFGRLKTTNGTELTQVFSLYGIFPISEAYVFRAVVAFASTQIKKYQGFMETIGAIQYPKAGGGYTNPPMWAHRWQLGAQPESNKKGKFFGYKLALANGATVQNPKPALIRPDNPLYLAAREFYEAIEAGKVTVDRESDEQAGGGQQVDDDIPF